TEFIGWLDSPPNKDWLDIGCGTGSLSRTILDLTSPASVRGIDPSESHVSFSQNSIRDGRASFSVASGENSQLAGNSFDLVVSGLVLNFIPDPKKAVAEMMRLTRERGVVAAYVWDYPDRMELLRHFWDAAVALDMAAAFLDEGNRFPLCRPDPLKGLFTDAGLQNVAIRSIDVPTKFENFDDFWLPFLGGQGPAPGYAMSLSEDRRNLLRDRIRSALPVAGDGSINLIARAWAIKGTNDRKTRQ